MSTITDDRRTLLMQRYAARSAEFDRVAVVRRSRAFGIRVPVRSTLPSPQQNTVGSSPPKLSPRELSTLGLVADGHQNQQIALLLEISEETVKSHVRSLLRKLGARNRTHMVTLGFRYGFLSHEA